METRRQLCKLVLSLYCGFPGYISGEACMTNTCSCGAISNVSWIVTLIFMKAFNTVGVECCSFLRMNETEEKSLDPSQLLGTGMTRFLSADLSTLRDLFLEILPKSSLFTFGRRSVIHSYSSHVARTLYRRNHAAGFTAQLIKYLSNSFYNVTSLSACLPIAPKPLVIRWLRNGPRMQRHILLSSK